MVPFATTTWIHKSLGDFPSHHHPAPLKNFCKLSKTLTFMWTRAPQDSSSNSSFIRQVSAYAISQNSALLIPSLTDTNISVEPGLGGFHVWQVKLGGDGVSLLAERLNSIPYGYAIVHSLTLGQHLMVCGMASFAGSSWVEVIWWEQCSATRDLRTRFSMGNESVVRGPLQYSTKKYDSARI